MILIVHGGEISFSQDSRKPFFLPCYSTTLNVYIKNSFSFSSLRSFISHLPWEHLPSVMKMRFINISFSPFSLYGSSPHYLSSSSSSSCLLCFYITRKSMLPLTTIPGVERAFKRKRLIQSMWESEPINVFSLINKLFLSQISTFSLLFHLISPRKRSDIKSYRCGICLIDERVSEWVDENNTQSRQTHEIVWMAVWTRDGTHSISIKHWRFSTSSYLYPACAD